MGGGAAKVARRCPAGSASRRADEAERSYNDAITIAQHQRSRSFELRAATSLARLLQSQGRKQEARPRLAAVFDWFTELPIQPISRQLRSCSRSWADLRSVPDQ